MVNLETVIIPDSITVISENAFSGCSKLTNLTLSNSIVHFGTRAFTDCKNLSGTFTITSNCTYVGNGCFARCSNVEIIIIPDSLEYIGASAFSNVASLIWQSEETTTWNRTVTGTYNSYSSASSSASYHSVTGTYELGTATLSATTAEDRLSGTAGEKWVKVESRYFSHVYYRDCTWTRVIN
ncbi:MAG: leucine-rich repeat domain-containing protein [Ruminococcaceae bacterium]|nr:leucine-rich repeat domain-containing protein [Oscillospiraceae bacterium]